MKQETDTGRVKEHGDGSCKIAGHIRRLFDPKSVNIHEDTSEEPKTDAAKGPNSADSKGFQDCKTRVHINKQSPDITSQMVCTSTRVTSMTLLCKFHKCRLLRKGDFESSTICAYAAG